MLEVQEATLDKDRRLTSDEKLELQLNIISEVGHKVLTTLDPEKLYSEVVKIIQEQFSYYALGYWSYSPNSNEVVLKAQAGYRDEVLPIGYRLPIDKGIVGWTVRNCKTYTCNNTAEDPYYFALKPFEYKSEIATPVEHSNRLLGVFNIESDEHNAFTHSDEIVIETIANLFAISIVNGRLHAEVKSFNSLLKQKIDEKTEELKKANEQILEQQRLLKQENKALKEIITKSEHVEIIGESSVLKSLLSMVDKVAPTDATVLIQGESGTGKELIARQLHMNSDRRSRPYVTINCGALQESLLTSELFGHEKGAFTGAHTLKIGLVETANLGTLFLDEIGELGLSIQAKLLRFLQEGEIFRVGGKRPLKVNVRIISATNKDLEKEVREGRFREDLFYRLNTITLRVPPLRKRKEDVEALVNYFLKSSKFGGTVIKQISPEAMEILKQYDWPGNIRELQNAVERMKILADSNIIALDDISYHIRFPKTRIDSGEFSATMPLEDVEKGHILRTLDFFKGNKTKTAKALGITIKTLYNKLNRYEMRTVN